MRVYLTSPFTHSSKKIMNGREKAVAIAAARLTKRFNGSLAIIQPIVQSYRMNQVCPGLFGASFEAWQEIDFEFILGCHELWVLKLKGWKDSTGVRAEIAYAKQNGLLVQYLTPGLKFTKKGNKLK